MVARNGSRMVVAPRHPAEEMAKDLERRRRFPFSGDFRYNKEVTVLNHKYV